MLKVSTLDHKATFNMFQDYFFFLNIKISTTNNINIVYIVICYTHAITKIMHAKLSPIIMKLIFLSTNFIRITCQCKVYPLKPHFYIVKLGLTGVNIETYIAGTRSLGGSKVYPHSMF